MGWRTTMRRTTIEIDHLFHHPQHRSTTAAWIYDTFWADKPGYSPAVFEGHLAAAARTDRIPLCRIALDGGRLIGTASLIEKDDIARPDLRPWLAAVIVAEAFRRSGIGSSLVRQVCQDAAALGEQRIYLGTDNPAFYRTLGAVDVDRPHARRWIMAFDLGG